MGTTLRILALGVLVIQLIACGSPTLDTSSDEAMEDSMEIMMSQLSLEEQERFRETLGVMYMFGSVSSLASDVPADQVTATIDEKLDGKTVKEIMSMADEVMIINE